MVTAADKIILFGASGHGKVIADIVRSEQKYELAGFIDDDPKKKGLFFNGITVLGNKSVIGQLLKDGVDKFIVAIGDNKTRALVFEDLINMGMSPITAIHRNALIAPDVKVGRGSVVMAGAVINCGTLVGDNSIVNTGCHIDHDCKLGDCVHISPGANLAGNVAIGNFTHIGIGACVIQGIRIGGNVTVGAGAVVIKDIENNSTVVGNPSRRVR